MARKLVGTHYLKKYYKYMIPAWKERPQIVAALANPAFCGKVLHNCFKAYSGQTKSAFPYALCFFILPIILHKRTRVVIPSSRKTLHAWFNENNELKINLPSRIRGYIPYTKESLMFLIANNAISISDSGEIDVKRIRNSFNTEEDENELLECFKKSETLGKILAKSGNVSTIYSIIGVRP